MLAPNGMEGCRVLPGTVQSQVWVTMLAKDTKRLVNSCRYHSPTLAEAEELPGTGIAPRDHSQMETIFCIHPRATFRVSEVSL